MAATSDESSPLLGQTQNASYNGNGRDASNFEEHLEEQKNVLSYVVYVSISIEF